MGNLGMHEGRRKGVSVDGETENIREEEERQVKGNHGFLEC